MILPWSTFWETRWVKCCRLWVKRTASRSKPHQWSRRSLHKTTIPRPWSWTSNPSQPTSSSWLPAYALLSTSPNNSSTSKTTASQPTSTSKPTTPRTCTRQAMWPATLTGTPVARSELSTITRPSIKAQWLVWTWQAVNSRWTMCHSSGPDSGTIPWCSVVLLKGGMMFILLGISRLWSSLLTTLTRSPTKL